MHQLDIAYSPIKNDYNKQRIVNPKKIKKIIYGSRIINTNNINIDTTNKITRNKTNFIK
jgi:hypothetical protein